ncbi:unnamed protein product [Adineta ricciae]|uniref:Uncharacterized protein n=1 Tax=Adineta ricciae TaxID=249248 RepID=A0A815QHW8_ADIRI|nr:unnamed protein product [Adineta ricciae]CAF1635229.1 unnamed protein product [Adineta ricciae]
MTISRFPTIPNSTLPSQYTLTTPAESILDGLMVENWNVTYSYETYYLQCRPPFCSFDYQIKTNIGFYTDHISQFEINRKTRTSSIYRYRVQQENPRKLSSVNFDVY